MRRRGEGVGVGAGRDRGGRADDADVARAGGGHRAPHRRMHDLDDGDVVALARIAQGGRAGGVAGDDEQLDAVVDEGP